MIDLFPALPIEAAVKSSLDSRQAKCKKNLRKFSSEAGWDRPVIHFGRPWQIMFLGPHRLKIGRDTVGLGFSPDGQRLIAGDYLGGVGVVWEVATGRQIGNPAGRNCPVASSRLAGHFFSFRS